MLSGVKFVPRDKVLSFKKGGGAVESDSDGSDRKRRDKRVKKGTDKEEKKRRRGRRRRSRYSSDSEDGSDTDDSIGEEEEDGFSRGKRRGKHRKRHRRNFSDDENESSSESEKERARGKGKRKSRGHDEDDNEEEIGDEKLRSSEVIRRELGLEWMLKPASSSRAEDNRAHKADDEEQAQAANEEVPRANPRELNPYLRDNGSGYPEESTPSNASSQLLATSVVGDGGASWRLKALKRAKEQAAREGRQLDEVVEERWGSLGHLAVSVSTSRAAHSHAHLHAIRGRKLGKADDSEEHAKGTPEGHRGGGSGGREYLRDVSSQRHAMRKPNPDSVQWKKRRQNISSEDQALISSAVASINKFSNDGSFMEKISNLESKNANVSTSTTDERSEMSQKLVKKSSAKVPVLSAQKLNANQLAAKILQLRMKGKHEEAEQLSREMEALLESQDTAVEEPRHERERSSIRNTIKPSVADRKKREEDADLHLANKIMHNKQYNMSKSIEDEYDFGDAPSKKDKRKNKEGHHDKRGTNRPMLTQKERCLYCFENPSRPKHLVVAIGNFTYLMLPQFEPVVPGHCVILPLQHESAMRTVDQNVWVEIRNFKKCLLQMFAQQDKDVVFMETVVSLARQRRHCMIECIPVPCEVSNNAPMYFKKAIDEVEEEWSQHEMKKLIATSASRNLRQVIPENFAYFHVEFGLDRGFVHVIDDENKFNAGFGLNVIRGMLRLPEEDMHRRRRHESTDKQKQAVASFMKDWEPFDWTKQLD